MPDICPTPHHPHGYFIELKLDGEIEKRNFCPNCPMVRRTAIFFVIWDRQHIRIIHSKLPLGVAQKLSEAIAAAVFQAERSRSTPPGAFLFEEQWGSDFFVFLSAPLGSTRAPIELGRHVGEQDGRPCSVCMLPRPIEWSAGPAAVCTTCTAAGLSASRDARALASNALVSLGGPDEDGLGPGLLPR